MTSMPSISGYAVNTRPSRTCPVQRWSGSQR